MEEEVRNCHFCGAQTVTPHMCPECGYLFCDRHRLPAQHDCEARWRPSGGKPLARRTDRAGLMVKAVAAVVVLGVALFLLDLLGIVDLDGLMGYLRGFTVGLT